MVSREASLITALTRLLGVFYSIRAIDQAANALTMYWMQRSVLPPEMASEIPETLSLLLVVVFYLIVAVAIFLLAPWIGRTLIPESLPTSEGSIHWNETMIFCCGVALAGWAITRAFDWIVAKYGAAVAPHAPVFGVGEAVYVVQTFVLVGVGCIMMAKFHRISAWMIKRKSG